MYAACNTEYVEKVRRENSKHLVRMYVSSVASEPLSSNLRIDISKSSSQTFRMTGLLLFEDLNILKK